jgi:hypothetical protein
LDGSDDTVYWFSWEEKIKRSLGKEFREWIDAQPAGPFNEQIYCGYKELMNIGELIGVMEERSAFRVRLLNFDKQLERPPDKPTDMLPRYNKVVLEVTKTRPVTIPVLTFDPFNLPFSGIAVKFDAVIDLRSKMRVRFKEISNLLGAKSFHEKAG